MGDMQNLRDCKSGCGRWGAGVKEREGGGQA